MNSPTTGIRQRAPSLTLLPQAGEGTDRACCVAGVSSARREDRLWSCDESRHSPASEGGMFQAATWLAPPGEDPRNTCKLRDRGSATPFLQARHGLVQVVKICTSRARTQDSTS